MDLDRTLERVKELIATKESAEAELAALLGGEVKKRAPPVCSHCSQPGHRADRCPNKQE